jgi:hypothetical protein
MKITRVETMRCGAGFRDFCFVKISTDGVSPASADAPGKPIVGWSEFLDERNVGLEGPYRTPLRVLPLSGVLVYSSMCNSWYTGLCHARSNSADACRRSGDRCHRLDGRALRREGPASI